MYEDSLTEAARRAIEAAAILAVRNRAPEREPVHLLWALVLEESQAAEALKQVGVTRDRLRTISPLDLGEGLASSDSADQRPATPESDAFRRVIANATQAASLRGRSSQIGTDDLLAALVSVASAASRVLLQLGVTSEKLALFTARFAGQPTEPIGVDFDIRWRDATEEDRTETLRIIDAAANRAREGLRMLEDYAPSHWMMRTSRAGLRNAGTLSARPFRACRPPPSCGRGRRGPTWGRGSRLNRKRSAKARSTLRRPPANACRRPSARWRSSASSGRPTPPATSNSCGMLCTRSKKRCLLTEFNCRELAGRRLYLLVTESLCPHGTGPAVRGALAGGAGLVQLREKEMPERRLIELGRRVRAWTREAGALYVMNDRADLAVVTEADGVHVGQDELSVKEARRIVGPHRLVGVSTHTIEQARQAVLDGADYIGVGPVFPSVTKSFESLAGLELVRQIAAEIALPWFAIGGINAENVDSVLEAGATRIAVSHAILSADDPESATKALHGRVVRGE